MTLSAAGCQETFRGAENDSNLADKIEAAHPAAACEAFAVSEHSPGPVSNDESLLRVIISPRDIDDEGRIYEAPFHKVYRNGLSVVRANASDDQIEEAVVDGLGSHAGEPLRGIKAVLSAPAGLGGVRGLQTEAGERLFGVYDQTVPREDAALGHAVAHAGIFLRLPPPGTPGRKNIQKDHAGLLRKLFEAGTVTLAEAAGGRLATLNDRAAAAEFVKADPAAEQA